ncbi:MULTISPECIES: MFS transporter [Aliiglaciecola]|uniref:MFS transporter n=1 Tax=Aliiglaciecola TaxID=1406885 RepID=UPI001C0850F1|nr:MULTISPECIES: MFS transporter [Aliiglaciecola]MBU2877664.1 MFS transporter [Aliiglaciecola lipolytica]MDO6713398.1 MFS transporter [Aliiglaciecola sp. 2_MG-2023]MDO6754532.1 MFS transporter [Aliiglaciecola sp. 1_MG-2023]
MSAPQSNQDATVWPILIMALGSFVLGLTEFSSMSMLPLIADSYNVSPSQAGNVISAYAIGVVIGAPLFMLLTNRTNRRTSLIIFVAMVLLGNGLSAVASSLTELIVYRVLSGLPHGAYFGTALLIAASMAPKGKRASYMAKVFAGLTIATIVGVPMATLIGQSMSWRVCMAIVAVLALITLVLIYWLVPSCPVTEPSKLREEFAVLKNKLVWSISGIIFVGFGGVFCIYTYLADTIINVTQTPLITISIAMMMFGVGTTIGNLLISKLADHAPISTTGIALLCSVGISLMYVFAASNIWWLYITVFLLGASVGLAAVIQSMLLDVSPKGHAMIGALVQCAFNTANAIGPMVGGAMLASGASFNEVGYASAMLFFGGFIMWALSYMQMRNRDMQPAMG